MRDALDERSFKIGATGAVIATVLISCGLLAHRAVAYQRGVRGAALYAGGDPARAYPYLVNAARSTLLGSLNAGPLMDLGDVATWAIDDPRFQEYHRELPPPAAARLAFVAYAKALRRRPSSSTAMAGMADLFRRVGNVRLREAGAVPRGSSISQGAAGPSPEDRLVEACYRKALEMEPANYFWYAYLADFLVERGRRAEALPLYGSAIELMPDLGWHYYLGSTGPLPEDMFQTVEVGLQRALRTNVVFRPERIESNIGYLHERQRDYDGALAHYRRAIELAADPSPFLYQAAIAFGFQGRNDEAVEYYRLALKRGTLSHRLEEATLTQLGRLLLRRGDARGAMDFLVRARDLEPASYAARLELGKAYRLAGEPKKAEAEFNQAIGLEPAQSQAYTLLIDLHRLNGDFARAIPLARRLVEMYPDDPNFKAQLDGLYRQMGASPPG
jgi:tetratricopeptide (TPR) repeat protein